MLIVDDYHRESTQGDGEGELEEKGLVLVFYIQLF